MPDPQIDRDRAFPPRWQTLVVAALATLLPSQAWAHEGSAAAGGFVSGLTHPLFGLDHVVAMVAVGLWGGQLKKPAIWLLPVTFPIVMAIGGMLGARGVPLPAVEVGIAGSAIVLGIMVAASVKPPLWVAALIVGSFAIFHGHAHGTELPESGTPLAYGAGFVISTGLLHAIGITIGLLVRWESGEKFVRVCGAAIACLGLYFLVGSLAA
jgi:urease accessory protein